MEGTGVIEEVSPMEMNQLGTQWVVELYGCSREKLGKAGTVEEIMVSAAKVSNSIITKSVFHEFNRYGVNGMVSMLSGAYFAVHTWPEKGYAALEVFTSGSQGMPEETAAFIAGRFGAKEPLVYRVPRGRFDEKGGLSPLKKIPVEGLPVPRVPRLVKAATVLFGLIF